MPTRGNKRRSKKREKKLARKRKKARKERQQWIEEKRNDELAVGYEADDQADFEVERRLDMVERMDRAQNRNLRQRYREHIGISGHGHGGNTHKNKISKFRKLGGHRTRKRRRTRRRKGGKPGWKTKKKNSRKGRTKAQMKIAVENRRIAKKTCACNSIWGNNWIVCDNCNRVWNSVGWCTTLSKREREVVATSRRAEAWSAQCEEG